MKIRLLLMIVLVGFCAIGEINGEKFRRTVENQGFGGLRSNDIDNSDTYQQIHVKKESRNHLINLDAQKIISETLEREDNELLKIMLDTTSAMDFDKLDSIGDQVISRANVSEETKRVARQVKKQRPGFFWTIFRVAFETVNETRSALQQINVILEANILPDTTTIRAPIKATTSNSKITVTVMNNLTNVTATEAATMTTTKAPYKLTRNTLQNIVRRNLQGLVRLFNIEWKDAINQSQKSIRKFQNELGKSASPFLVDNPAAY